VKGCDNLSGGYLDNIPKYCEWDQIDILNQEALAESMVGSQIVVHAAALAYEGVSVFSPKVVSENIYAGTISAATAAIRNKVELFIQCSSMARYGEGNPPFKETDELQPQDPYGLAKVHAEEALQLLNEIHGLHYYIVVPHNIVGHGQVYTDPYRNVAAIFTNRILLNKSIIIYGNGSQLRSFSPVGHCVEALNTLIWKDDFPTGEVFNIGPQGNEISIKNLAYLIAYHCYRIPTFQFFPERPQEVKNAYCSSEKAINELEYNATASNDETVKEIIAWVRERGPADFEYKIDLEIVNERTPKTWTKKLI